ncbi:site-specific integrase [Aurantimonas sp. C2-6-R+9]|uniref:site-specific integrase n=1 Tax=unclassified Aurantimonas TaxID=2638230 RepID=UPI002E1903E4|nr:MULTISPECIES: site-specific integrase [unclassified Aurantimonas]MEC5293585.1 site-specific integrase [Aurantimonas sp. C2-3-R2]MEC5383603.1 site-specific integrase [Aurantimonas sp. C2-6-R+9]MEC5414654.1 site-specific integrase [Aurantimonas sp. C2-4-R8]
MATIRKLRGRWQAQVRRRGMKPRAKSFDSKAEAERWARDLETQVDRFGAAPDTRLLESTTLRDLLARYQGEVTPKKRGHVQESQRIDVLLRHELAHRTLIGLSAADLAAYRDERLQTVSPATAVRELAILSHVLEVAMSDWGYPLSRNPAKAIRRPQISNARECRLQGEEEARLLTACDTGRTPCLRALIIVAGESGMRRGELLGLRWSDVALERGIASLSLTKNGSSRQVPLTVRAIEALRSQRVDTATENDRVFPISAGALEQAWRRLCERASVTGLRFHDLRHEAVSRLFEKGLNVIEVSAISGHRELKMLKRYTHLSADDLVARIA